MPIPTSVWRSSSNDLSEDREISGRKNEGTHRGLNVRAGIAGARFADILPLSIVWSCGSKSEPADRDERDEIDGGGGVKALPLPAASSCSSASSSEKPASLSSSDSSSARELLGAEVERTDGFLDNNAAAESEEGRGTLECDWINSDGGGSWMENKVALGRE